MDETNIYRIPGDDKEQNQEPGWEARIDEIIDLPPSDNKNFIIKCFRLLYDFGDKEKFSFYEEKLGQNGTSPTKPYIRNKDKGIHVPGDKIRRYYEDTIINFSDKMDYYLTTELASTNDTKRDFLNFILKLIGKTPEHIEEIIKRIPIRKPSPRGQSSGSDNMDASNENIESQNDNETTNSQNDTDIKGKNLIIYGAPGTGKSYYVEKKMELDKNKITRVVFHPEYTYFDFVGQYRPYPLYDKADKRLSSLEGNEVNKPVPYIDYRFVPGPFTKVLVEAYKDKNNMYTLLIEELNRADAPAVFGEVFQLLDRNANGESEYGIVPSAEWGAYLKSVCKSIVDSEGKIKIPSNMNIVATMNSADQGVHVLDTAFKRRWEYMFMRINDYNNDGFRTKIFYNKKEYKWEDILTKINDKLRIRGINEDRLIGPYFVSLEQIKQSEKKYPTEAYEKILFYLWDDVLRNNGRSDFFGENNKSITDLFDDVKNQRDVFGITDGSDSENGQSVETSGGENNGNQ